MANRTGPGMTEGEIEKKLFKSDEEDLEMNRFSDNERTNVFGCVVISHWLRIRPILLTNFFAILWSNSSLVFISLGLVRWLDFEEIFDPQNQ
jgi:hypothetical protein